MIFEQALLSSLLCFAPPSGAEDSTGAPGSDADGAPESVGADKQDASTEDPDADADAGGEDPSDAEMDAFFGMPEGDEGDADARPIEGPTEGPPTEGPPDDEGETETIVSGTEVAPAGELDLSDIFGTDDTVEEMPDITEGDDEPRRSLSGLFNGKLDLRVKVVSSVYIDVDNLYQGRRWNPVQPTYDESRQPNTAFKVGQAIPRGTISRNENRLEFYFSYQPNEHVQIVGDIEPVFLGVSQLSGLDDLSSRQLLAPFHMESDAAYVALHDALPGLDIRIGRQIVVWGTADKFNPTNNINADDFEDRPLFTEPIANQMLVVDLHPWGDKVWFQGVYVPIFYPALLPPSASFALADPQSPVDFANQTEQDKLEFMQGFITANEQFNPRVNTRIERPPVNITNGQAAAKIRAKIGQLDLSGSYYYGFHDVPIPYQATSENVADLGGPSQDGYWFTSDVTLVYPRMHVAGLDFATQLGFLDDLGLWGEAGLFIPTQQYDFEIEMPLNLDVTPNDGSANPVSSFSGPIVRSQPFVKATVGADYTIGKHIYLSAQYLRGMIDEFGAGNIGNYVVAGTDLIFFGRHLIFRFFTVTDFPENKSDRASVVLAPNIIMVPPWGFATLELGGFAFIGRRDTNFGQAAVGSSIAYLKISGAF